MDATRQRGTSLDQIRHDHLARYRFAAGRIKNAVILDAACGIGYGSWILHKSGHEVVGMDIEPEALETADEHYWGPTYRQADLNTFSLLDEYYDLIVSFETLEHLANPSHALREFRNASPLLIASVPNEERYPFDPARFAGDKYPHQRHYRPKEFDDLLRDAGWDVIQRHCQKGKFSDVELGTDGMFLVYVCT